MDRTRQHLPAPATLIALLALMVALSGSAYAASVAKNSVGSGQVRNGSLKGADIKDGKLSGKDIDEDSLVGVDAAGQPIQRAKFRRETLLQFFERAAPAVVGMEACPGAQWLARKVKALGHTVRIVPAQFVKPYVKSNKNDTIDAAAIAEAEKAANPGAGRKLAAGETDPAIDPSNIPPADPEAPSPEPPA